MSVRIGYTIKPASRRRHTRMISKKRARTRIFFLLWIQSDDLFIIFRPLPKQKRWDFVFDADVVKLYFTINISNIGKCSSCAFPEVY